MGRNAVDAPMASGCGTWVENRCRPLGPVETRAALRKNWSGNQGKPGRTLKSDQLPLLQGAAELRAQLQGCGGP